MITIRYRIYKDEETHSLTTYPPGEPEDYVLKQIIHRDFYASKSIYLSNIHEARLYLNDEELDDTYKLGKLRKSDIFTFRPTKKQIKHVKKVESLSFKTPRQMKVKDYEVWDYKQLFAVKDQIQDYMIIEHSGTPKAIFTLKDGRRIVCTIRLATIDDEVFIRPP